MTVTMYMVTHKTVDFVPKDRTPIFVGGGDNKDGYITDKTGDNIASKNKNYCELTAVYWAWKNDNNSDVISIEHYRRFFNKPGFVPSILSRRDAERLMQKYDVVVSRLFETQMTIGEFYKKRHCEEDYYLTKDAIAILFPQYLNSFYKIMNSHKCCMLNMLIIRKDLFNDYCEWLFAILNYVEERNDLSTRSQYQQRAFGFLGERLLNVWLEYQQLNIGHLNIFYKDGGYLKSGLKSFYHSIPKAYIPSDEKG